MKKIRIAVIGAGIHSSNMILPSFASLNDYFLQVAVCDLDERKAKKSAKQYGFDTFYTDYNKMLKKEDLDGVIVIVNGKQHPKIVMDCLKSGIDILVEKPMALTVEEALEIEETEKKYNKIVMVEHQKRYSTAYTKAMEIVKQKDFGDITMIESKAHAAHNYASHFNCFVEWNIHNIDIVRAFAGDVKNLKAVKNPITEKRSAIAVLLEFENGIVGTLNWGTEGGFGRFNERLEIVGSNLKGVVIEDARDVYYYEENEAKVWKPDWRPIHDNFTHVMDGYVGIMRKFAECIQTRKRGHPSAYDERKALEVIHEIRKQLDLPLEWSPTQSKY